MNRLPLQENLKKYSNIENCPVRNIISRFSGKWAMLILCVLSENEATRFNAISKALPDISPKVLTETLKAWRQTDLSAENFTLKYRPERNTRSLTSAKA